MILILDFDGVVFDYVRFKKDCAAVFKKLGASARAYYETYDAVKKISGGYLPVAQIESLKKKYPAIHSTALAEEIKKLTLQSARYLYSDARAFLMSCKKSELPVMLVSAGSSFQKQKIAASNTRQFFKKVVVVIGSAKSAPIQKIIRQFPKKQCVFVDDRADVLDEIKRILPDVFVVQMLRGGNKRERSVYADARVRNFLGLEKIINAQKLSKKK